MTEYLATDDVELSALASCVQLSLHEAVLSVSSNDTCIDAGTRLDGSHRGSIFCTTVSMTVLCEKQPLRPVTDCESPAHNVALLPHLWNCA